jgi:hypothetical protein
MRARSIQSEVLGARLCLCYGNFIKSTFSPIITVFWSGSFCSEGAVGAPFERVMSPEKTAGIFDLDTVTICGVNRIIQERSERHAGHGFALIAETCANLEHLSALHPVDPMRTQG